MWESKPVGRPARERFEEKIVRIPIGGCWIWMACTDGKGYGRFSAGGKTVLPHRFAYQEFRGPVAEELLLCHTCDVPECVNPWHMFIGTQEANMRDAASKGRTSRGKHRPTSKLTDGAVRYILNSRMPRSMLAQIFNVHDMTIGKIKRRELWKHVKP